VWRKEEEWKTDPGHRNHGQPLSCDARKALRYAHRKLKLIKTVPEIEQYTKDEGAERETDYIFSEEAYFDWIGNAPESLRSASILARRSGICRDEILHLMKDYVRLYSKPIAGRASLSRW
jgi:hypothetical protein